MSNEHRKMIVVLGATGQQGGAVCSALLDAGHFRVRAISRNPSSEAAKGLIARGIDVVAGDLDDATSLRTAFAGAHGVYSVQGSEKGAEVETRRGVTAADAALAADVKHFVYASVGGAERRSDVPHFDSKWKVEEHIYRIGLPASIVRPVFFMDNFATSMFRNVLLAMMSAYVPREKTLQMIATADIGRWAARAFADPSAYLGKAEELAGDEMTRKQIVAALKRHGLSAGPPFPVPKALLRPLPYDVRKMFEWFGTSGYKADIPRLRAAYPDLMTLQDWLRAR